MKRMFALCVTVVFFMSHVVIAQSTQHQETYGLCIGIAEYDPADLSLKWADKDAGEFGRFLKDGLGLSEKQYKVLKNREATKKNILKQLEWLQKVAKPGDRVYIFYSGHGKRNSPLLPYNSDNLLSLDTLQKALSKINAKEIILFADANYSGKITGVEAQAAVEREGLAGWNKKFAVEIAQAAKADMIIITSADRIQPAYELIGQKYGLFTEHLVRALMDKERYSLVDRDDNGELTLYEVYERVFGLVANESDQEVQITDPRKAKEIVVLRTREPSEAVAAAPTPTPIPKPTPTPAAPTPEPEKKGMSKGKITALSLGAAVALGGGIALAVSGGDDGGPEPPQPTPTPTPTPLSLPTPETCAGVRVGGYCWYLGTKGQSCSDTCALRGGYHEATRYYAGSDGTDHYCQIVMDALGAPGDIVLMASGADGLGCYVNFTISARYRSRSTTTAGGSYYTDNRACACNE